MFKNLDKKNLHHAYLIEGDRDILIPQILEFVQSLGVEISNNADFSQIIADVLKVEDARSLKALSIEKGMTSGKRIFLISANNILPEAQNTLLKMFEEPIENTHFFLVLPDKNVLLRTLFSRFYFLSSKNISDEEIKKVDNFLKLNISLRIDSLKEMLKETEVEADEDMITQDSARARALNFLNALEYVLHKTLVSRGVLDTDIFEHLFKVRKFLRMPGSSAKNLMESIALTLPKI